MGEDTSGIGLKDRRRSAAVVAKAAFGTTKAYQRPLRWATPWSRSTWSRHCARRAPAGQFHPDRVPDEVLERLLDTARFAPSGGNRQGWRVIVVKDPAKRRALRDIYLPGWYEYLAMGAAGLVPLNPLADPAAEAAAVVHAPDFAKAGAASPGFAETLDTAPALLLILADLAALAPSTATSPATHSSAGRPSTPSSGAFSWPRTPRGSGGVTTTVAIRREAEVKALFAIPDTVAVAALVVLGRPVTQPHRLTRAPVSSFAWVDRYEGPPLADA